jgi:hypothetical protein
MPKKERKSKKRLGESGRDECGEYWRGNFDTPPSLDDIIMQRDKDIEADLSSWNKEEEDDVQE